MSFDQRLQQCLAQHINCNNPSRESTTGQPVSKVSPLPDPRIVALLACYPGIFGRWPI